MGRTKSNTSALDSMIAEFESGRGKKGIVGFADDPSEVHPRSGETAYTVAIVNNNGNDEGGAPAKPARPFFDDALNEAELELRRKAEILAERIIMGDGMTVTNALKQLNRIQEEYIRNTLRTAPARYQDNAPATVESKGFDRALFETGWLEDQLQSAVVEGEFDE